MIYPILLSFLTRYVNVHRRNCTCNVLGADRIVSHLDSFRVEKSVTDVRIGQHLRVVGDVYGRLFEFGDTARALVIRDFQESRQIPLIHQIYDTSESQSISGRGDIAVTRRDIYRHPKRELTNHARAARGQRLERRTHLLLVLATLHDEAAFVVVVMLGVNLRPSVGAGLVLCRYLHTAHLLKEPSARTP